MFACLPVMQIAYMFVYSHCSTLDTDLFKASLLGFGCVLRILLLQLFYDIFMSSTLCPGTRVDANMYGPTTAIYHVLISSYVYQYFDVYRVHI